MSEKLEIEIIDDGGGNAASLSPDDFRTVREFNAALARLKAAARAKEFEESQELKARRNALKDQKQVNAEVTQAKRTEIQQTRLNVQEMKARRQLEVAIQQEQRARDSEFNKKDRHREMMLRHVLGAINPNSTFQYRMSSIYGLLNTAGITSVRNEQSGDASDQTTAQKVDDVLGTLSSGLKNLFGQTGAFIRSLFGMSVISQKSSAMSNLITSGAAQNQQASVIASPPENDGDENPWWWNLRRKSAGDTNSLRAINNNLLPKPKASLQNAGGLPFPKPANIKMAIVQGGNQPPAGGANNVFNPGGPPAPPAGGSPAGGAGGGNWFGKFATGVAANLGSIAVTGAMVAGIFTAIGAAGALLSWRFQAAADELRMWSGALIGSSIERQMRLMSFNVERAQKYGEDLAGFEQSRTNVEIAMTKLGDSLTMAFIPIMNVMNNVIVSISNKLTSILDAINYLASGDWFFESPEQRSQFHNFWYNVMSMTPFIRDWFYGNQDKKINMLSNIALNMANFLNAPVNPQTAVNRGTGSVGATFILPSNFSF